MNETFEAPQEGLERRMITPLDVARAARAIVVLPTELEQAPVAAEPQAGDEIERDGEKFILVPAMYSRPEWNDGQQVITETPYTYRQYYSHTFYVNGKDWGDKAPGPGWDSRSSLHDAKYTLERYNREFTSEQLKDIPSSLPDDILLEVKPEDSDAVEAWRESQEEA